MGAVGARNRGPNDPMSVPGPPVGGARGRNGCMWGNVEMKSGVVSQQRTSSWVHAATLDFFAPRMGTFSNTARPEAGHILRRARLQRNNLIVRISSRCDAHVC